MTTIISLLNKLGGQAELSNLSQQQLITLAKQHGLNAEQINLLLKGDTIALEESIDAPKIICNSVDDPNDVPDQEDAPAEDDKIKLAI
ncbi:hypothetical protein A9Q98_09365 [Thalassotalea sp. 42_200_T64]|nr:hypothetical protein A9Q98_09365 [Thalassotalea sp. 42_200_T64]